MAPSHPSSNEEPTWGKYDTAAASSSNDGSERGRHSEAADERAKTNNDSAVGGYVWSEHYPIGIGTESGKGEE